jgi:hypothetical protein
MGPAGTYLVHTPERNSPVAIIRPAGMPDADPTQEIDELCRWIDRAATTDELITLLEEFLSTLPNPHHERPGVIRAIEVLRDLTEGDNTGRAKTKPLKVEWYWLNRRSRVAHAFIAGPGQLDTSLCGIPLSGGRLNIFEGQPLCRFCAKRANEL